MELRSANFNPVCVFSLPGVYNAVPAKDGFSPQRDLAILAVLVL